MKKMSMDPADNAIENEIPEHEVHSAAQDLMRAEQHKANPKMMKKVHAHLNNQKAQISSIQDLKNHANKMMKQKQPSPVEDMDDEAPMPGKKKS